MKRRGILKRIGSCLLLFVLVFQMVPISSIYAMDVSGSLGNFITSVKLTNTDGTPLEANVPKGSDVKLTYEYAIPNAVGATIQAGDTITISIPEEILVEFTATFDLRDTAGNLVGTGVLNPDNTITITLSAFSSEWSNVHGSFWFDLQFDEDKIGNEDPETIEFYINGSSTPYTITVDFEQPAPPEASITKSGSFNPDTNEITWTITANPENLTVNNASVSDTLAQGLEFVENSVLINGNQPDSATTGSYVFDTGTGIFTYTFPSVITTQQVITFKTTLAESEFTNIAQGTTIKKTNEAQLTYTGGVKLSNTAEVNIPVKYIVKNGVYNATTRAIDWTIEVNKNALSISNAVVTDILPVGLTLETGSLKVDGANISTNPAYSYIYTQPLGQTGELQINLGAITDTKVITYSTPVDADYYLKNDDGAKFTNTATLTGGNVPGDTTTSVGVGVPSDIVVKDGAGYDRATGKITWTVTVNTNKVSILNPIVSDNILPGQKYVDGSAQVISGIGNDVTGAFTYTPATDDPTKTGTLKYTVTGTVTDTYVIQFQTEVTDPSVYADNTENITYYNTASVKGDNIPASSDQGSQKIYSNILKKSGVGYDYVSRQIEWKIVVNENKTPLNGVVITDVIPTGFRYVEGSFSIDNGASLDGLNYEPALDTDTEKTGIITYTFPSGTTIDTTYTITFKTEVVDLSLFDTNGDKTVSNTVKLIHDDLPNGVTATGTQKIKNTMVEKTAEYTPGTRYIDWSVNINGNDIPLTDAVLTDTLQEGLELDTSSIKLYSRTLNADGTFTTEATPLPLTSANVSYDTDTRLFSFALPSPASGAYLLTFRTDIVGEKGDYTNEISFAGSGKLVSGGTGSIPVSWVGSGSTGFGEVGSVTVTKVDEEDQTVKLSGAVFELLDQYGNSLGQKTTDDNGEVLFERLRFDVDYTIREVSPPTGYLLGANAEPYIFQISSATEAPKDITYSYSNKRIKGKITFTKLGEGVDGLPGAVFSLYATSDTDFEHPIATATSGTDGTVLFNDVAYGSYVIKETTAPEGYLLSSETLSATIQHNGVTVIASPASISDTRIRGSITFTKLAEGGEGLPGAVFSLYAIDDTAFANPIATATSGIDGTVLFSDVAYGSYTIKETTAPVGYLLSTETLSAAIIDNGVTVTTSPSSISDTRIRGNIKLVKVGDDGAAPLEGAEIGLYLKSDTAFENPIATVTSEKDGLILFEDVLYGEYIIKEIAAPTGYVLSELTVPVTVTENAKTYDLGTFKNSLIRANIEIHKVNAQNEPLKDARFALYDQAGELVGEARSDENGLATFSGVPYGSYTIKETQAPATYLINTDIITVTVETDALQQFTVVNQKDPQSSGGKSLLPKTGDMPMILVGLGVVALLGFGISAAISRRKRTDQN